MGDSFSDDLPQWLRALGAPFEVVAGGALCDAVIGVRRQIQCSIRLLGRLR
jgi:hypothetical protein